MPEAHYWADDIDDGWVAAYVAEGFAQLARRLEAEVLLDSYDTTGSAVHAHTVAQDGFGPNPGSTR